MDDGRSLEVELDDGKTVFIDETMVQEAAMRPSDPDKPEFPPFIFCHTD